MEKDEQTDKNKPEGDVVDPKPTDDKKDISEFDKLSKQLKHEDVRGDTE